MTSSSHNSQCYNSEQYKSTLEKCCGQPFLSANIPLKCLSKFRILRSPTMQNLNYMYFFAAFGKEQFKLKATLNTSRVCVCDHGTTNRSKELLWNFQNVGLIRNVCLISTQHSSWHLLHHTTTTTQKCVWRGCHLGQWSTHRKKTVILPVKNMLVLSEVAENQRPHWLIWRLQGKCQTLWGK